MENVLEPTNEELPTETLEAPLPQVAEETGIIIPEPSSPTGDQKKEDAYFFDDFSSNAFGWPVGEEDGLTFTLQNNTYSFSSLKPNHIDWVYLPVDFAPIETRFTVKFPAGSDHGWFGVICQYQDEDNFYTVDIDPLDKKYIIGQMKDQEYNPLSGEDWKPLKFFDNPLNEKNKIGVSCYPTAITLYINDKFVTSVIVKQPVKKQGKAGIFINTAADLSQPYLLVIDNVEVWQPKQ